MNVLHVYILIIITNYYNIVLYGLFLSFIEMIQYEVMSLTVCYVKLTILTVTSKTTLYVPCFLIGWTGSGLAEQQGVHLGLPSLQPALRGPRGPESPPGWEVYG